MLDVKCYMFLIYKIDCNVMLTFIQKHINFSSSFLLEINYKQIAKGLLKSHYLHINDAM